MAIMYMFVGFLAIALIVLVITLISLLLPIVLESFQEVKDLIEEWKGE